MQVSHRGDHRHGAAAEHAVVATGDAVAHVDLDAAEPVTAVAHVCGCDRIGDERSAPRHRAERDLDHIVGDVLAVHDQLDDHVVTRQRAAGDTGVAVGDRAHRVEEVRDRPDAPVERGLRPERGRVRVAARHDHAALVQQVDDGTGPDELGRKRHVGDRAGGEQPLGQRDVRIAARRRRVHAEPLRRDERALEVDAEQAGADRVDRNLGEPRKQLLFRCSDEGRMERRHAGLEQCLAGAAVPGGVCRGEVDAAEAVHLQVDEAGNGDAVPLAVAQTDRCNAAVRDVHVAPEQDAVDDRRLDAELHAASSDALAEPPTTARPAWIGVLPATRPAYAAVPLTPMATGAFTGVAVPNP
jgi:hypothetical protein